jgi:hypothetical protein
MHGIVLGQFGQAKTSSYKSDTLAWIPPIVLLLDYLDYIDKGDYLDKIDCITDFVYNLITL